MAERPRIYYPVKPFVLNQPFAQNQACVRDFGKPTQSVVGKQNGVCPIGYDELYPHFGMRGHNGLDLRAGEQNCYAALAGTVVEKQTVPARGLGLGIMTNEPVNLDQYGEKHLKLRYWHLKQMFVEVGDKVEVGDLIGITDNTGYSAGNHLHFEGQPMNMDAGGHPYIAFNGSNPSYPQPYPIAGGIDIEPYFIGQHAQDLYVTSLQKRVIVLLQKLLASLKK